MKILIPPVLYNGGEKIIERYVLAKRKRQLEISSQWTKFVQDTLTFFVVLVPIYGFYYPLESYVNAGDQAGSVTTLPLPVTTIVLSISLLLLFVVASDKRARSIYSRAETLLLLGYVSLTLASILWAPDAKYTLFRAARLLPPIGFALVFAETYSIDRLLGLLTRTFLVTAAASTVVALVWPEIGLSHLDNGYEGAWRGVLVHKNFAGFLFSIGVLVTAYAVKKRTVSLLVSIPALLLCILDLVKSESATAMVATVVALAAAGFLSVARRTDVVTRALILGGLVLLLIPLAYVVTNPEVIASLTGRDMTFTGRTPIWQAVGKLISNKPVQGYGYGFWGLQTPERDFVWAFVGDKAAHSHNSWLDIWLQCGVFGLCLLVAIILSTVWRLAVTFVTTNKAGVILFIAILVSLLVRSATEVEFTDPGISGVFWLALAAGYAGRFRTETKRVAPKKFVPLRPLLYGKTSRENQHL